MRKTFVSEDEKVAIMFDEIKKKLERLDKDKEAVMAKYGIKDDDLRERGEK